MTYHGEIHNGTLVLDEPVALPEGSRVECVVIALPALSPISGAACASPTLPMDSRPVWERIVELSAQLPSNLLAGVPADGASQLDHHLYGTPKHSA